MRVTSFLCAFGATVGLAVGAQAQSINCGGTYTVKRGDTLQQITNQAYGSGKSWTLIYNPNKRVVGRNPSLIEVGMRLRIPCLNGRSASTQSRAEAEAAAAAPSPSNAIAVAATATQATPVFASSDQVRFVTGTDWAPFSNQDQEQGGMITEMVTVAMTEAAGEAGYKIDFINDWSAHLEPLISDVAYDFTFPWFRPNCAVKDKLGPSSQFRCDNLDWSDPLFEQVIGYYMRADDAAKPADHTGLFGRKICRPKGYSTFMMEEKDLREPRIELVTPNSPADCFELLEKGDVDAVVLASMVADDAISRLAMADNIEEQPQLATIATLHAVTSIDNPNKEAQLELINAGIREMRESGRWFEIVQRHLIAHARLTATQ